MVLFDFQQVKSRSSANSTAATDVSPTVPTARSTRTCTRPTSRTTAKCAAATSRTRIHHRYVSTWKCTENLLRLPVTTRMPTPSTPIATLRRRRRLHRHRRRLFRTTTTFSSSNSSSSNSSSIRYLSGTFVKVRRACRRHRRRSTRPSALWLICTTPSLLLPLLTDLFYVALLSLPAFIITKLFLPLQKKTKTNKKKKIGQKKSPKFYLIFRVDAVYISLFYHRWPMDFYFIRFDYDSFVLVLYSRFFRNQTDFSPCCIFLTVRAWVCVCIRLNNAL